MYKVGICSNNKSMSKEIENMLLEKYKLIIFQFTSINRFCDAPDSDDIDVLIIDIQHSKYNILAARNIQEKNNHVKIIFLAENIDEIANIFEAEPTYLLFKPIDKENLYHAMEKAIYKLSENDMQILKLYFKSRIICIPYEEILYIESDRRYLLICQKNKTDKIMMKMSEIIQLLPDYFVRCHQSYIINIHKMIKFEKNRITVENGYSVAVSRNRWKETKQTINKIMFSNT